MASQSNFNPYFKHKTNPKHQLHNEMKSYIQLARFGHFPLFFKEWIEEGCDFDTPMSYQVADRNVREVFKDLARHRTQQKKKTALIGLEKMKRDQFIRSFVKVVEHNMLKDIKTLH